MAIAVLARCVDALGREHRCALGARMSPAIHMDRAVAAFERTAAGARGRRKPRAMADTKRGIRRAAEPARAPRRNGTRVATGGIAADCEFAIAAAHATLDCAARGTRAPCERRCRFAV